MGLKTICSPARDNVTADENALSVVSSTHSLGHSKSQSILLNLHFSPTRGHRKVHLASSVSFVWRQPNVDHVGSVK